ncbi:MAG: hypothetical protein GQ565_07275 [Candidatus Aegiribacteria sp.]|nr:hypothetical protein [Candidatus Aegiribacteria sp.]
MILFDEAHNFQYYPERCCQCGICLAVCPVSALSSQPADNGLFTIGCNEKVCVNCGRCSIVCPAQDLPYKKLTEDTWAAIKSCLLGHTLDNKLRFTSSSGGVVRTIIHELLEKDLVDVAYCLVDVPETPWVKGEYIEKEFDVSRISNSTYRSVPFLKNCITLAPGTKLLVIGTNCQLLAIEHFYRGSDVELLQVALLCKQQKHDGFTQFIKRRLGLLKDCDTSVSYRGNGWPGRISINGKFINYADAAALPFAKRLWTVPGCAFCANALGATADITVADPWEIVSPEEAGGGMSLIIIRTEQGFDLIESARDSLHLTDVCNEKVLQSINWSSIQKKVSSISVRLGKKNDLPSRVRMYLLDIQKRLLEWYLDRVCPPRFILKALSRLLPPGI